MRNNYLIFIVAHNKKTGYADFCAGFRRDGLRSTVSRSPSSPSSLITVSNEGLPSGDSDRYSPSRLKPISPAILLIPSERAMSPMTDSRNGTSFSASAASKCAIISLLVRMFAAMSHSVSAAGFRVLFAAMSFPLDVPRGQFPRRLYVFLLPAFVAAAEQDDYFTPGVGIVHAIPRTVIYLHFTYLAQKTVEAGVPFRQPLNAHINQRHGAPVAQAGYPPIIFRRFQYPLHFYSVNYKSHFVKGILA